MIKFQLQNGLRTWPRTSILASAYLIDADHSKKLYQIDNLSASGVLLTDGPDLDLHTRYQLVLNLPDSESITVSGHAVREVVDADEKISYGFTFLDISPDTEDLIHNILIAYLEKQQHISPTVMIVDDCVGAREKLSKELDALGITAVSAAMPLDALRLLGDKQSRIDTAIVDLSLGPADGFQFLKYLEKEHPHIRRILVSGDSHDYQLDLAVHLGHAHAVLPKQVERNQIEEIMQQMASYKTV